MDRTTRQAAVIATAVALPLALIVALLAFWQLSPDEPDTASPSPSATPAPAATTPVTMAAPPLTPRAETLCRALLSKVPAELRDRAQRPVTAGPEQNAAYGDPAITLACGIPAPEIPPTDLVNLFDRVCWHSAETAEATVLTTVDREVTVQVTVPRAYEGPAQWTIPFSKPVIETIPRLAEAPTGCAGSV